MGIKPLKLYQTQMEMTGSRREANRIMAERYLLSPDKIALLDAALRTQLEEVEPSGSGDVAIYVGIPFCPSRCAYCSFTMEEAAAPVGSVLAEYMKALTLEMEFVTEMMTEAGLKAESIYIGGGTPTVLEEATLSDLLGFLRTRVPGGEDAELTVEAGRPDTVTEGRCQVLSEWNTDRVCVNPQSMNTATLRRIGRRHDAEAVTDAWRRVRSAGIANVNMDVIAGLPGEEEDDFHRTMEQVWALAPENISVHTLSLKRGSRLWDDGEEGAIRMEGGFFQDGRARQMICGMREAMEKQGYRPYYLYRQKYIMDNLENVAYAKPGTACIYNMRIMEERQTVIAMGAGGGSKVYYPEEKRIERVYNVSNHEVYIERIDEMMERKRAGLFEKRYGIARR
jgi:oxygen-independent coproporphyrinogen-3 oxidase